MRVQRAAPANELLAKLLFLVLPTAVVAYFLFTNLSEFNTALSNFGVLWTLCFTAGMLASTLFHAFRLRALIPFLALIAFFYFTNKGISNLALGEFDLPRLQARYWSLAVLFPLGWVIAWGFVRVRYWSIIVSASLLAACIYIIAKFNADTVAGLMLAFAPALLYSLYIIFTTEQIYAYGDKSDKFWWFLSRRLVGFSVLVSLLLMGVYYMLRVEIRETVAAYGGGGGKGGKNSMLKQNKDKNTFDLNDYSRLSSALGRSNEFLFCAHIENFFPGTDIPNPLYLTAFYYTKFDTSTETFEKDKDIVLPKNDLFEPDPSKIPLFATRTDSSVIRNSGTDKAGSTVEVQVYSKLLSPNTYLAPHTGYFVQPITVEKDFRDSFKYAFRAKSYVSELNSAYFVYNAKDEEIRKFQEQRFALLRKAPGYEREDRAFMKYYTYMPGDEKFQRIGQLAKEITAKAVTPVDKVIALRDWFLSKDPSGQPLFRYTDNPGIPDIPNASKLMYFLFENHKGYCAYYAGATLFMLRSLGIPSRIAVGFLTVDRSGGKNKGWYWYYADQAHAWVQVYFPGYGWLDFDTTVGNDEAQQSPKPDGTPPLQPPMAYLSADGVVTKVDTAKKTISYRVHRFNLHDKEYSLPATDAVLDVHIAAIRQDSIDVPLHTVKPGDSITAVSYADAFKNLTARSGESAAAVLERFPEPEPIDEVYIKRKADKQKDEPPVQPKKEEPASLRGVLLTIAGIFAGLILLFFAMPALIMFYYRRRAATAKTPESKAYWSYRTAGFYLNQLGYLRGRRTPMQYARDVVDPALGTAFTPFMNAYLKVKYAKQPLTAAESERVNLFLPAFLKQVGTRVSGGKRTAAFFNPLRSIAFFVQPGDDEVNA